MTDNEEAISLRDYQVEGAKWLYQVGRGINADQAGLGKTPETLFATGGWDEPERGPQTLIVCPSVAIGVWVRELKRWLDQDALIFSGTPKQRGKLTEEYLDTPLELRPRYVITTYRGAEWVQYWQKRWELTVYDEAHIMRNRKSKAFEYARALRSKRIYLLTASPIVNHVMDLWPLFYLIDPGKFRSYWRFAEEHCHVFKGEFGFEVSGPKDPARSRRMFKPYILRRTKKQVLPELPPKTRKPIPLEMTDKQRKIYDELANEKLTQLENGEIVVAPNKMSELLRLRQVLVTPALIGGPNSSAALDALKEEAEVAFSGRQPVAVYCPFASAFEFIIEVLEQAGAEEIYEFRGGMGHKNLAWTEEAFRKSKKGRRACVISLLSATSFSIEKATTGFFLGSHWNPEVNSQAEDRMHRMTTVSPVFANYFIYKGTVEEHVLDIVNKKLTWSNLILDPERLLFGSRKRPNVRQRTTRGTTSGSVHLVSERRQPTGVLKLRANTRSET